MFPRSRIDSLRSLSIIDVLVKANCKKDTNDSRKWRTSKGLISVTGQKFFNWNTQTGGGGAIDLSIHLFDFDFKSSLNWLEERFSRALIPREAHQPEIKRAFSQPPPEARNLPGIVRYLSKDRGIPLELVHALVSRGKIYADRRGNVVFPLLGKERKIVGAELRGSSQKRWIGMAKGSRKDLGMFFVTTQKPRRAIICESAIDAISAFVILPDCMAVSTSGANPRPAWLNEFLAERDYEIFCGFDSDEVGDSLGDRMISRHPRIKRLRPEKHDWNEILRSLCSTERSFKTNNTEIA